jgi:hypothetical protein
MTLDTPGSDYLTRLKQGYTTSSTDSGYIKQLKELADERDAAKPPHIENRLARRIALWWNGVPASERKAAYGMTEFVALFKTSKNLLGVALHECGWQRNRRWPGYGPYVRVWSPPSPSAE